MSVGCIPTVSMACGSLWPFQPGITEYATSNPGLLKAARCSLAGAAWTNSWLALRCHVSGSVHQCARNNPESHLFLCWLQDFCIVNHSHCLHMCMHAGHTDQFYLLFLYNHFLVGQIHKSTMINYTTLSSRFVKYHLFQSDFHNIFSTCSR